MKLSKTSEDALAKLAATEGSPYQLELSMKTLNSLVRRGLATRNGETTAMTARYTTTYKISESGDAALALVRGGN
ncbi:hypothetical protein [Mesorhizobium prunaredense]|nr:hypothetical protein [Mesorhizobium prunaredense]